MAAVLEELKQPITILSGISKYRADLFRKIGVESCADLLNLFPRRYEDWTSLTRLADLVDGPEQVFLARVNARPQLQRKGRLSILRAVLSDDSGSVKAVWFNQAYHQDNLKPEAIYLFRGKVKIDRWGVTVNSPTFERLQTDELSGSELKPEAFSDTFLKPVYPLTAKLTQGLVRKAVAQVLEQFQGRLPETLPAFVRRNYQLAEINYAYEQIHRPIDREKFETARRRLDFEELFCVQFALQSLREANIRETRAPVIHLEKEEQAVFKKLLERLPFALTGAQKRVLREALLDLERPVPMNRLVQGDVGSGKTVVASLALLAACLAGYQGALMAPTGVLARQHFRTVSQHLEASGLQIALLTGKTKAAEKKKILARLALGEIDILIGTHALFEDRVVFKSLGLAVTDEQHRFGVKQRIKFGAERTEGSPASPTALPTSEITEVPHVMVMSATPIPRSLALILYGDLDISIIDELPEGRQPVLTYTAREKDRSRVYDLMRREMKAGRQCYCICPMVKESEGGAELTSAEETYKKMQHDVFPDLAVGLIYGALKEDEKQAVMQRFLDGELNLLVATTVVEVGVDNPNATLMLIEDAGRFGLSQLHQLRGRIGRGSQRSICILLSEVGEGTARDRLRTLCASTDGFAIAEADLELRGPGDFFGTRQHGLPEFKIANLYEDRALLQESGAAVAETLSVYDKLSGREQAALGQHLIFAGRPTPDRPGL